MSEKDGLVAIEGDDAVVWQVLNHSSFVTLYIPQPCHKVSIAAWSLYRPVTPYPYSTSCNISRSAGITVF